MAEEKEVKMVTGSKAKTIKLRHDCKKISQFWTVEYLGSGDGTQNKMPDTRAVGLNYVLAYMQLVPV